MQPGALCSPALGPAARVSSHLSSSFYERLSQVSDLSSLRHRDISSIRERITIFQMPSL